MQKAIALEILTPDKLIYRGSVAQAVMPGVKSPFVILYNHAPLISVLQKGRLLWRNDEGEHSIEISGGFVEVNNNVITACVELL